jgi:cyclic-di-GMP-binding protein
VAAIHHYISGGAAVRRPVIDHTKLTPQQRQELETLGRVRTAPDEDYSSEHGFLLEDWLIEERSPQELRMRRAPATAGKRYAHGQLMAVRPAEGRIFLLGQLRWLTGTAEGELRAGIKLIPGAPAAIALRTTGLNEKTERWVYGLALGPVPAVEAPPSLVLPAGSFKPNRVYGVQGEMPRSLRVTALIERGTDFERVAYEPA